MGYRIGGAASRPVTPVPRRGLLGRALSGLGRRGGRGGSRNLALVIAVGILALFVIAALAGGWLCPFGPDELGVGPRLQPPSAGHWFGTDALGRDQFSRVVAAAQPALQAAVLSVGFALVVGTAVGVVAGFVGGWCDSVLSRAVDLVFALPGYLVAVLLLAVFGSGLVNASVAIGLVVLPRFARIARGETLAIVGRSYVDAARLCGGGAGRIMWRHILPNISSPLAIMTAINLATVEGEYAALSFLGFGVRPPAADYGSMISSGQEYLLTQPWLVAFPSIAFVVLVLGFSLLGDAMRDHLDPRNRTAASA